MNLVDVCLARSNELTRILAGCLSIAPNEVLPMLERLKPESLTDVKAGRYIEAVNQHYHDTDETDDITEQIARDLNMLVDYCIWIVLVRDWHQDALNAVREMQALAVTVDTLESLQSWIQTSEELSAWH